MPIQWILRAGQGGKSGSHKDSRCAWKQIQNLAPCCPGKSVYVPCLSLPLHNIGMITLVLFQEGHRGQWALPVGSRPPVIPGLGSFVGHLTPLPHAQELGLPRVARSQTDGLGSMTQGREWAGQSWVAPGPGRLAGCVLVNGSLSHMPGNPTGSPKLISESPQRCQWCLQRLFREGPRGHGPQKGNPECPQACPAPVCPSQTCSKQRPPQPLANSLHFLPAVRQPGPREEHKNVWLTRVHLYYTQRPLISCSQEPCSAAAGRLSAAGMSAGPPPPSVTA